MPPADPNRSSKPADPYNLRRPRGWAWIAGVLQLTGLMGTVLSAIVAPIFALVSEIAHLAAASPDFVGRCWGLARSSVICLCLFSSLLFVSGCLKWFVERRRR